jgi:hypothetical protein
MQAIGLALNDWLTQIARYRTTCRNPCRACYRACYRGQHKRLSLIMSLGLMLLASCQSTTSPAPRTLNLQQKWELEPGMTIGGKLVTGSLGDVSIELNGARIYAPFVGEIEKINLERCIVYSTPEVPAYLFRLCGLRRVNLGKIQPGQPIGSGAYLQFATLRRQPDGTWIIVEPAKGILERVLNPTLRTAKQVP